MLSERSIFLVGASMKTMLPHGGDKKTGKSVSECSQFHVE
jgi:hypothetical protein